MQPPLIIVNFKAYPQGTGKSAIKLAKEIEEVAKKSKKVTVAIAVQAIDLRMICDAVSIPVLAQHVDPEEHGAHTGAILAQLIDEAGAAIDATRPAWVEIGQRDRSFSMEKNFLDLTDKTIMYRGMPDDFEPIMHGAVPFAAADLWRIAIVVAAALAGARLYARRSIGPLAPVTVCTA